jgi:ferric-dicitrate binding protein FerR (iron transport regulator)
MGKKEILLPDGSSVTLNTGSSLTFRDGFGSDSREVILNGEAFFNVKPNKQLPFRVFSGESVVEVTGTSFSVYQVDGEVHVAVITGRVLLSSTRTGEQKMSISANQSGFISGYKEVKIEEGIPANVLSWKTGILVFEQTPIDSALIDIAHHFRRDLSLEIPLSERITAEFQDQPLHEILNEIALVAGLSFDTTGTALIVRK